MEDIPKPDSALSTLIKARAVREVYSDMDATEFIRLGYILVGVCVSKHPDEGEQFIYSLIWTREGEFPPSTWR
jgi:hypothetical protein